MTSIKKPAAKAPAKKVQAVAAGATDQQLDGSQDVVLSSPEAQCGLTAAAQQLQADAAAWHKSGTDPRQDVHAARRAFRIQHEAWPTILSVSALVFEDICNDLGVAGYIAGIPQRNVYDRVDRYHALMFLAPYFGVQRVEIDPDEQAASVS
ncbi:MAG: hypothetical protein M3Y65_25015 [Pseudomonadota bacterium]|nr:hypothetical protein [Pseudomonadota bacterium]